MDRIEPVVDLPPPPVQPPGPAGPDAPPGPRRRWLRWTLIGAVAAFLAPPVLVLLMRWVPPVTSAFMLQSPSRPVDYRWVPATQQPDYLRRAVVAAEDQKFWTHDGFDFEAIEKALEHNQRSKRKRGASTITQQLAKNLFLWPGRSWLRKGVEVSFTVLLEALWPKERIMEVYLNIAEFGPGIYGVEAAAQKFFRKPAAKLTPLEAARLAAVLPNPRQWKAQAPGPYVQKRTNWILGQIGYRSAVAEPLPPEGLPEPGELPADDRIDGITPADSGRPVEPAPDPDSEIQWTEQLEPEEDPATVPTTEPPPGTVEEDPGPAEPVENP